MRIATIPAVVVLAGVLAMTVACAGAPPARPPAAPAAPAPGAANIIDLMPAFWAFWARAEGAPAAERVALLKEIALAPHREFYEKIPHIPADGRLEEYLETLAPAIPALRRIEGEFRDQLPGARESFLRAHPDADPGLPIYVGPSLFTSSGQVRDLDGRTIVFYGLDVFAVVLPDVTNHVPDIHHEMFHAYHWQRNAEIAAAGRQAFERSRTTPVFYDLWIEGLALLATRRLDPDAPLALVLASSVLPGKAPPVLAQVAGELRQRLDVTDINEVGDYFFFRTRRTDIPPRVAYYVGLRVAEEVARHRTMEEMIRLGGADLRREVEAALRALETSGGGTPGRP